MDKLLEVKNLQISFPTYAGKVQAVRNVSFEINEKETVALVGESGCGKSVTAKAIMGLVQQRQGQVSSESEILFKGKNLLTMSEKEWQNFRGKDCSIVFQDALAALNPTIKVGKQIKEVLKYHKKISSKKQDEMAIEILRQCGIQNPEYCMRKYPMELSGGQRQRIMIAIALICHPELLIADEPTTALDVTIQAQILELIAQLQKSMGISVLLITHDLGVVAQNAHRVIVMYAGKIIEEGSVDDIFEHPQHPYTWALLNAVPKMELDKAKNLESIEGTLPSLIHPPKGCPFSERCKYCMHICNEMEPEMKTIKTRHKVACHLQHEWADRGGIPFEIGGVNDGEC